MKSGLTKKEQETLRRLQAKQKKAERERKAFERDVLDNKDLVTGILENEGYTVIAPLADSKKAEERPDLSGAMTSQYGADAQPEEEEDDEPFHFFGGGEAV